MLKHRVMTAVLLLLVLGGAVLCVSEQGFAWLAAGVVLLAAWEWANLAGWALVALRGLYVLAMAGVMAGLAWRLGWPLEQTGLRDILGLAGSMWAVGLVWVMGYPASSRLWGNLPVLLLLGFLILVPCWLALAWLRGTYGLMGLFYVIGVVSSADIGAYFAGRAWGRHKLAPAVSPGKSWEGFWGGLAAALVLGGVAVAFGWFPAFKPWQVLLATAVTSLASVLGDLVESMVKRFRGIKDSGRLLPGHGGVMDRLDSLTAAAPVFALFWLLWGGLV